MYGCIPLLNSSSPEYICVLSRLQMFIGELTSLVALIPSTLHWKEGLWRAKEGDVRRLKSLFLSFASAACKLVEIPKTKSCQPGQVDRPGESS